MPYFFARPASDPPWPGVVVVLEGSGLSPQLTRVCQRLAHEGYAAIAPDLYWRFGGSDPDLTNERVLMLRHADGRADIAESVALLRQFGAPKVGITGFCMGGGYAYHAAVSGVDVDAAAPFYGGGIAQHLAEPQCPLLMFFGGKDEWVPPDDLAAVETRHPGQVVVYPWAGHGFFRDGSEHYDEAASKDAWRRLLAFFAQHLH